MNTAPATPPEKSLSQPPASPMQPPAPADGGSMLRWVMAALAIWGMLLALGAALFQPSAAEGITLHLRPLRGLLVLGCVAAFLGGWQLLLTRRRRTHA